LLKDYRDWLESELKLLGNASDHAYSFGQANMAKRAIEKLDEELARNLYVAIDRAQARRLLTALEALEERTTSIPAELAELRGCITAAMEEANENPAL
jgi:glutamate/tyrosine decarboxylase-like PLP-dependent enzyme